ncbi:MAG: biotin/lipoyl-binding protein, partial [Noviherbaspirillum sp.]
MSTLDWHRYMGLLARYRIAFVQAWKNRHADAGLRYAASEAQFLPAALALQETPVPAAPRVAMGLLIAFGLLAVVWAVVGKIDIVATAHGKIVTNGRTKTIQSIETARVSAIHVRDGQFVRAGEVLIELDATAATADIERVQNELASALLQSARAQAMLDGLRSGKSGRVARIDGITAAKTGEAQRQADSLYAEFQARLHRIAADIERREAEWRSVRQLVDKLEQTVPLARQRAADYKKLVDQNFIARHAYMDREQSRIEQEADLASQRSRLEEIAASLREGRAQRQA